MDQGFDGPASQGVRLLAASGGLQFHPWRDLIAWGGPDGAVSVWSPYQEADRPLADYHLEGDVTKLAWHPVDDRLAVATSQGIVSCLALIYADPVPVRKTAARCCEKPIRPPGGRPDRPEPWSICSRARLPAIQRGSQFAQVGSHRT